MEKQLYIVCNPNTRQGYTIAALTPEYVKQQVASGSEAFVPYDATVHADFIPGDAHSGPGGPHAHTESLNFDRGGRKIFASGGHPYPNGAAYADSLAASASDSDRKHYSRAFARRSPEGLAQNASTKAGE